MSKNKEVVQEFKIYAKGLKKLSRTWKVNDVQ